MKAVVGELLLGLAHSEASQRALAADRVTDWLTAYRSGYTADEAVVLAEALAIARLAETDPSAAESELNALASLAGWHDLPAGLVSQLSALNADDLGPSEREHLADLVANVGSAEVAQSPVVADFSVSELTRLLVLIDRLHGEHPERSPTSKIWLPNVGDFALNGEPDMTMRDLSDWIAEVRPAISDEDTGFIIGLAAKFPAEGAEESLRTWLAS